MNARTDVRHSQIHADRAVLLDRDRGAGFARAGRSFVDRNAAADIFSFGFFPAGSVQSFLEYFLNDNTFELLSKRRWVSVVEQVFHAKRDEIDAQLPVYYIDVRFHRERRLWASRSARLGTGNLIGVSANSFDLNRGDTIVTRRAPRSLDRHFSI